MGKGQIYLTILVIFLSACTNVSQTASPSEPCMNLIEKDRDDCFRNLAIKTGDDLPNICAKISDKEKMTSCLLELVDWKYHPYDCNMFESEEDRDECYMMIGANMKKLEICDRIINQNLKDNCYKENVIYFNLDKESCGKIQDESIKTMCIDSLNSRG
jgi:hypothetical protein